MAEDEGVVLPPTWVPRQVVVAAEDIPGLDEVFLVAEDGRTLCNSLAHKRLGLHADLVAQFGHFGHRYYEKDSVWCESWGQQIPFCQECWAAARSLLEARRPGLTVVDKRSEGS